MGDGADVASMEEKYRNLRMDQAKRLKELEKKNDRLKHLLTDTALNEAIRTEAASGNYQGATKRRPLDDRFGDDNPE